MTGAFSGGRLTGTVAERLAAAQYVKQAIAKPFLKWWSYLVSVLPSRQKRSGEEGVGAKDVRVPANKHCYLDCSIGRRDQKRSRSVSRSRNGQRSRVGAWQSLLSLIVNNSNASDEMDATRQESDLLCSLVDSSWSSSERNLKWHTGITSLPSGCFESDEAAECFLKLSSLLHEHEHLVIQFAFIDSATVLSRMEQNEQMSCSCDHQRNRSSSVACRTIDICPNIISAWLSWVLRRHTLLTVNSAQS